MQVLDGTMDANAVVETLLYTTPTFYNRFPQLSVENLSQPPCFLPASGFHVYNQVTSGLQ